MQKNDYPKLRECPFCGGKVKRVIGVMGLNFFKCKECGAVVSFDNDYYNTHKNEAIEAWNRRVNDELDKC
ncbi:restriction alleviation protein, Lar family [[Clostridium] leptum]|uniref:Restriction alleviation protein, Lar family n=1 Tax=[Clostridium] leptum TaxID=1535 RepID=A0A412AWF1_9FIRM|nr:restriction alleviation protein, Lar family [[Clostridium] leptum]